MTMDSRLRGNDIFLLGGERAHPAGKSAVSVENVRITVEFVDRAKG